MCLIAFAWGVHPKYKLILIGNRDEFYDRPTAVAGYWDDQEHILAGRDLKANGTWTAVSSNGKFAAVTNYRDLKNVRDDATSRGDIPTDFINSGLSPYKFLQELHNHSEDYNGFNVILGDQEEMLHYSNYERKINPINRGIYGLSNALLDTPWPKVERAKQKFASIISQPFSAKKLIEMMADTELADEQILPDTGIPKEMELGLSAMCIRMTNYGTCSSTAIMMDLMGAFDFAEKSYPVGDRKDRTLHFHVDITS